MDFLKAYVKFMAYYKMNDFHIHLNDNGFHKKGSPWDSAYAAFRLQCDTYPGLTARDGSYTKAEFRAFEAFARSYGINIVPEIDVPAHSLAFSRMRPDIGSKEYGMDHLDLGNPATYRVIDSVFGEYLVGPDPVFSGPDVHIGTDEYNKKAAEQFRAFTDHYIRLVQSYGKNVRLWGALTHAAGVTPVRSKGVTMNVWYNGYADPKEMEKLGYGIISTPDAWVYIVPHAGYYHDYLDTAKLYNEWEPIQVGNVRFPEGDAQIRGGSFAVWNDKLGSVISCKDVNDRVFPAMQVLSQKMWRGTDTGMTFAEFCNGAGRIGVGPGPGLPVN
jgi:hexosaminidase